MPSNVPILNNIVEVGGIRAKSGRHHQFALGPNPQSWSSSGRDWSANHLPLGVTLLAPKVDLYSQKHTSCASSHLKVRLLEHLTHRRTLAVRTKRLALTVSILQTLRSHSRGAVGLQEEHLQGWLWEGGAYERPTGARAATTVGCQDRDQRPLLICGAEQVLTPHVSSGKPRQDVDDIIE